MQFVVIIISSTYADELKKRSLTQKFTERLSRKARC